jgi:hypothetical protein
MHINSGQLLRQELNNRVGETICAKEFRDSPTYSGIGSYLSKLHKTGYVKRIKHGEYKILKEVKTDALKKIEKRNIRETTNLINNESRKLMREELNKRINKFVNVRDFTNAHQAADYLRILLPSGCVERVDVGIYKILKKIKTKRRGAKKGIKSCKNRKDLSIIPTILRSSDNGIGMVQLQEQYCKLTPIDKQVNQNYLYRIFTFGIKEGVIKNFGKDINLKIHVKGSIPKRYGLINNDITTEEWDTFLDKFRLHYQYQQAHKLDKVSKFKTVHEKVDDSGSIIKEFDEERDNPNKQFVESYFLNIIKNHLDKDLINCLTITGPDYNRHVGKLFSHIANHITICEKSRYVFNVIYKKASICPFYLNNQVSLINDDIANINKDNCYYIDLDLMATIKNIKSCILKQINNQKQTCNKNKLKFLSFTSSMRKDGGEKNRIKILKELLFDGFELEIESLGDLVKVGDSSKKYGFCGQYLPKIKRNRKVKDLVILEYKDYSPMLSVLIVYR